MSKLELRGVRELAQGQGCMDQQGQNPGLLAPEATSSSPGGNWVDSDAETGSPMIDREVGQSGKAQRLPETHLREEKGLSLGWFLDLSAEIRDTECFCSSSADTTPYRNSRR